jgi:hypothetical protein
MGRRLIVRALLIIGLTGCAAGLRAEVKTEEKSQVKMEGMMGRMMGMFGGKAAKEGEVNTVAVKGDRKVTANEYTSEIIDLGEQKIYQLDLKKKTYEVVTFEEMRRRLEQAQEKAAKAAKDQTKEAKQPPADAQMQIDFSLKESGQTKAINGYDCREVVATIAAHEQGKALEESGGMVMTSHIWLGPKIPALKELADFELRYAKAMDLGAGFGGSAEQMAMAMAMYPAMKEMIGKMQAENVNMEGAQIFTEMTMETVKNQAQMSQEQEQKQSQESDSSSATSVRGLGGMLGRRLARKKEPEGETGKPANRSTVMTVDHELLKVAQSVPDSDLAIPAGFKEKK